MCEARNELGSETAYTDVIIGLKNRTGVRMNKTMLTSELGTYNGAVLGERCKTPL